MIPEEMRLALRAFWKSHRRLILTLGAVVAACILLALAVPAAIVADGLNDEINQADVAVVMGSKVMPDGTPSARLEARLDRTVELYQRGFFPCIIVSGGFGREGYNEAKVMADYLVQHSIPKQRIIEDPQGLTTWRTAVNTAKIMRERKMRSALVVSQYFHLSRSRMSLRKCGIEQVYSAHARFFALRDLYSVPREAAAYLYYLVR